MTTGRVPKGHPYDYDPWNVPPRITMHVDVEFGNALVAHPMLVLTVGIEYDDSIPGVVELMRSMPWVMV